MLAASRAVPFSDPMATASKDKREAASPSKLPPVASTLAMHHEPDHSIDAIINSEVVLQQLKELGYSPESLSEAALQDFVDELKTLYEQGLFDQYEAAGADYAADYAADSVADSTQDLSDFSRQSQGIEDLHDELISDQGSESSRSFEEQMYSDNSFSATDIIHSHAARNSLATKGARTTSYTTAGLPTHYKSQPGNAQIIIKNACPDRPTHLKSSSFNGVGDAQTRDLDTHRAVRHEVQNSTALRGESRLSTASLPVVSPTATSSRKAAPPSAKRNIHYQSHGKDKNEATAKISRMPLAAKSNTADYAAVPSRLEQRLAGLNLSNLRSTVNRQVQACGQRESFDASHSKSKFKSACSSPLPRPSTSARSLSASFPKTSLSQKGKKSEHIVEHDTDLSLTDTDRTSDYTSHERSYLGNDSDLYTSFSTQGIDTISHRSRPGFIRVAPSTRRIKKHDPVARFHQHQAEWSRNGALKHSNGRSSSFNHCISSDSSPEILSRGRWGGMRDPPVSSNAKVYHNLAAMRPTYVVPSEKSRRDVVWEVRSRLAMARNASMS
ncbi:hypothetical protein BASA50_000568 [Batrachochytrium salamandrivorans]|uniref:Centriolar and ciliogenesis-associated protein HYLS1 C-terminal domain-containing protein n=1 Tax=Batrachochytrium salamandrivorans TaxID=1357716 RepID=A0ABQ8EW65_9FUNG|nr:hypothetical protein BASA60_006604 [Batrachochytrium salamandrivorans]KAH6586395.1 hypothetical protein BASA50_000568 [Batrachochytrium salamandrivorans]KAH6602030.1 hypothetical protein BASA61_001533 [Batrachochytrium salamandrivorans]KAH9268071.1 hypothetical protein BASA83_009578 [Batrachochytrium salamandrivorans]